MKDFLIIAIIILVAVAGVFYTVKHFKGEGGCCGGGRYTPKRKKLKNVIYQKTFKVDGMHCANCKTRVEETINDVRGIAGKVDLKKGLLTVSYSEETDDGVIIAKLERLGYTVTASE